MMNGGVTHMESSMLLGEAAEKAQKRRRRSSIAELEAEYVKAQAKAPPTVRIHSFHDYMRWMRCGKTNDVVPQKVSLLTLLSYSTCSERWYMIIGLIAAFVSGLGIPAWLILLAKSLDKFSHLANLINIIGGEGLQARLQQELEKLVVAFLIVGGVVLVTGSVYVAMWTYTGEQQALRIKTKFVKSCMKQNAAWFDERDREELPTTIATSMIHINTAIGRQMADTFVNATSAAGCLAVALVLNTALSLIMLCVVPFVALAILIISWKIRKVSQQASGEFNKAGALSTETISGIKTVASLCAQRWSLDKYEGHVRQSQKFFIKAGFLTSLASGITGLLFYVTYTMAFFIGTEQVADNATLSSFVRCFFEQTPSCKITGASVMCAIYGVILCATFFGLMQPGIQAINSGRQAAVDVFETINRTPEIDASSEKGDTLDKLEGKLELRNVSFTYPSRPNNPIFYNFQLEMQPGESVALVGPSGSGKSTVARLLLRFYDPQIGNVLVDDTPLSDLNVKWWRSQVGYVAQEPTLFPGSIYYNIACGKEGATRDEVINAAKAACAHEFIEEFPDRYDTFYSGASIQLSGGQMQRIAIARAIIRNPSILLLDEATSALDSNSEQQVQIALAHIRSLKKVTTVTVAHRLSTILNSDKIAVISDGGIAEMGTHRELFELSGIYTTLCMSQGITAESKGAETAAKEETAATSSKPQDSSAYAGDEADLEKGVISSTVSETREEEEELASLRRILLFNKQEIWYLLMGTIGSIVTGALSPSEAILTAQIVANYYVKNTDEMRDANRPWTLGFLAFAGAALIGNLMVGCGLSVSGYRLSRRMRVLAYNAIVRRPMAWFDVPNHSTGELTTRLAADSEMVANITGWQYGYKIRTLSSLITGVVIALIYSWQVGLIAIACVPMIMGAYLVQSCCLSQRFVLQYETLPPATILEQGLRGIAAVQAYGLETKVGNDYSEAIVPESKGKVKLGYIAGLVYGFSQCSIFISFALVFYTGAQLLTRQKIDFVSFFTSVLSVMFGALGAGQVSADFKARQDGQAAAARIFEVVDGELDSTDPFSNTGKRPDSVNGHFVFENVYFYYPTRPNNNIYYKSDKNDGFSLDVPAKQSVAFVGRSGCGKSTALQIVMRFYEGTGGSVTLDGHKLEDLNVMWLREQIGYVGQQPVLFSGTVRSNILLGKPDATDQEIIEACKAANAHGFVSKLSDGYDTDIGTAGSLLSGGQKQRVAIARAIVKNPKILVLDEATSALDNESERIVQAALDEVQRTNPRTSLVVAHRLMTVKECDKIAVLGDGGVNELGSHDELVKTDGLYSQLWSKQGAAEEREEQEKQEQEKKKD